MNKYHLPLKSLLLVAALAGTVVAQPALIEGQTTPEMPCAVDTSATAALEMDSVIAANGGPDANGWMTIFDGKGSAGWFNNCRTTHSNSSTLGMIARVDTVRRALYTMQRGTSIGGLFTSKKKFAHYEIVFEWWPQYGNDGGVFNRTTLTGRANQTVLDYMTSSAIYGIWSEAGFPSRELGGGSGTRNYRPWAYNGAATPFTTGANGATTPNSGGDTIVTIPGSGGNGGPSSNWTSQTAIATNPEADGIGCEPTGCVQADLRRLWNKNGWNQGRIVYFGGLSTTQPASRATPGDKVRMYTYTRIYYPKTNPDGAYTPPIPGVSDTAKWVPVLRDSIVLTAAEAVANPASWIGFQIHNGSRFVNLTQGGRGTWYRNIRIRELDSLGSPTHIVSISPDRNKSVRYDMRVVSGMLAGSMELDHVVFIRDLQGRLLHRFTGDAGRNLRYKLPDHNGVMLVQVMTSRGAQNFRVNRVSR
jgi:hypothetical protein